MTDRRRSQWIAFDSGFFGSTLGVSIGERFGGDGCTLWAAYLCACKRNLVPGQISYFSDADAMSKMGLPWMENPTDASGLAFTLDSYWTHLGRMKQTARTTRGRVTYVTCTRWVLWQQDAHRDIKSEKQRRSRAEITGTIDPNRDTETRRDRDRDETETETETRPLHSNLLISHLNRADGTPRDPRVIAAIELIADAGLAAGNGVKDRNAYRHRCLTNTLATHLDDLDDLAAKFPDHEPIDLQLLTEQTEF